MSRPTVSYQIPRCYELEKPCVYKISFNGKYIIVKAKNHIQSVNTIQKSLNQFLRGSDFQQRKDGMYFYFFDHVRQSGEGIFEVEPIFETESQYELLKREQIEIDNSKADTNFLNNSVQAYIPLYNEETELYGWISKGSVLNFKKWLKNRQSQ